MKTNNRNISLNSSIAKIAASKASTDRSSSQHLEKMFRKYSGRASAMYNYTFPNEQNVLSVPGFVKKDPSNNLISTYLSKLISNKTNTAFAAAPNTKDATFDKYKASQTSISIMNHTISPYMTRIDQIKEQKRKGTITPARAAADIEDINKKIQPIIWNAAGEGKEIEVLSIEKANESTTEINMNNTIKNKIKNQCYIAILEAFGGVLLEQQAVPSDQNQSKFYKFVNEDGSKRARDYIGDFEDTSWRIVRTDTEDDADMTAKLIDNIWHRQLTNKSGRVAEIKYIWESDEGVADFKAADNYYDTSRKEAAAAKEAAAKEAAKSKEKPKAATTGAPAPAATPAVDPAPATPKSATAPARLTTLSGKHVMAKTDWTEDSVLTGIVNAVAGAVSPLRVLPGVGRWVGTAALAMPLLTGANRAVRAIARQTNIATEGLASWKDAILPIALDTAAFLGGKNIGAHYVTKAIAARVTKAFELEAASAAAKAELGAVTFDLKAAAADLNAAGQSPRWPAIEAEKIALALKAAKAKGAVIAAKTAAAAAQKRVPTGEVTAAEKWVADLYSSLHPLAKGTILTGAGTGIGTALYHGATSTGTQSASERADVEQQNNITTTVQNSSPVNRLIQSLFQERPGAIVPLPNQAKAKQALPFFEPAP